MADEHFSDYRLKETIKESFKIPRETRKLGGSAHKRGFSLEQVCVPYAIDRKGHSYAKITTFRCS